MGRRDEQRKAAFDAEVISSRDGGATPEAVLSLANRLGESLGITPKVTYEAKGYHIYVPCPCCIPEHGRAELADPKMPINADKYLALTASYRHLGRELNPWESTQKMGNERERRRVCCCMRQLGSNSVMGDNIRHYTTVEDLLNSGTLHQRFPEIENTFRKVTEIADAKKETNWVLDEKSGQLVPPPPGQTIPLEVLAATAPDHPVLVFIRQRGFDWKLLVEQFGACYCETEWPHGQNKIWYKDFGVDGWKDTPQGRLILYTYKKGVPVTWQARILEWESECGLYKFHLHPYKKDWVLTHSRPTRDLKWIPYGDYATIDPQKGVLKWKPSKYKTATHSYRSSALMGWDKAIEFNYTQDVAWCCIGEGPLDAARVRAPGLACLGKTLPGDLPKLVVENFEVVFTIFDNDASGIRATDTIKNQLMRAGGRIRAVIPVAIGFGKKDAGEMTYAQWDETIEPYKNKHLV